MVVGLAGHSCTGKAGFSALKCAYFTDYVSHMPRHGKIICLGIFHF